MEMGRFTFLRPLGGLKDNVRRSS